MSYQNYRITRSPKRLLISALVIGISNSSGIIDFDQDGLSDFWTRSNIGITPDESDTDLDGFTNHQEMIAGTDPRDKNSYLSIKKLQHEDNYILIHWDSIGGKSYDLEALQDGIWSPLQINIQTQKDGAGLTAIHQQQGSTLLRLKVRDIDNDRDGITGWEEAQLGWDDKDLYSSGSTTVQDFGELLRLYEQPEGFSLKNGTAFEQRLPSGAESSRFLQQATFGPDMTLIEDVAERGITSWLDEQTLPTPTFPYLTARNVFQTGFPFYHGTWRHAWWRLSLTDKNQLRLRLAYALSQLFVINTEQGGVLGNYLENQVGFYDPILRQVFGKYRDHLEHISYSSAMGIYLSHMRNRKADPEKNRFPDENFAREIMQLFSIGLWELNEDGTQITDDTGNPVPTYDNETITELAKVFTGMAPLLSKGGPAKSFYDPNIGEDYAAPMRVWDEEHDHGEKILFGDIIIPEGQGGEKDIQMALDILSEHRSTAPFVSRFLINRFTCSNPSPDYIYRVSKAWKQSGGNLGQVLTTILLDPEIRLPLKEGQVRGKSRESIIRFLHFLRAFPSEGPAGDIAVQYYKLKNDLGYFPMSSPTVFNFYSPSYAPAGEIRNLGLVAPEMELYTMSTLLATHNLFRLSSKDGHSFYKIDYADEMLIWDDLNALINRLDLILTAGTLNPSTKSSISEIASSYTEPETRVQIIVDLITNSPEFSVLK